MTVQVRSTPWDDPAGVQLRTAQRAEVDERYGRPDSEPGPAPTAESVRVFVVAFLGEKPVGCGALRQIDAEHGEIKRMYVTPEQRGSGVSTAVLRELERLARSYGWQRLVLETGEAQPDAIRFYTREGFTPIPCWGYYAESADSRCYGKSIAPAV